jgi:hypothetical protein
MSTQVMLMRTGAMRRFVGIDSVDAISGMANGFSIPSLQTIQDVCGRALTLFLDTVLTAFRSRSSVVSLVASPIA